MSAALGLVKVSTVICLLMLVTEIYGAEHW